MGAAVRFVKRIVLIAASMVVGAVIVLSLASESSPLGGNTASGGARPRPTTTVIAAVESHDQESTATAGSGGEEGTGQDGQDEDTNGDQADLETPEPDHPVLPSLSPGTSDDETCRGGQCQPTPIPTPEPAPPLVGVPDLSFHRRAEGVDNCTLNVVVSNEGTGPAENVSVYGYVEELVEGDPNKYPYGGAYLPGPTTILPGRTATYQADWLVHPGYPVIYEVKISFDGGVLTLSSPYGTVGTFCDE